MPKKIARKLQSEADKLKNVLNTIKKTKTQTKNRKNKNNMNIMNALVTKAVGSPYGPTAVVKVNAQPKTNVSRVQKKERFFTLNNNTVTTELALPTSVSGSSFVYNINPGSSSLFPYLSQVAALYNRYKFGALVIEYIPSASGFAATAQTGRVIIAFNPDARDPFISDISALTSFRCVEGPVWEPLTLVIPIQELDRGWPVRYVDAVIGIPPGVDIKTYAAGTILGGCYGGSGTAAVGELFARYVVDLFDPINRSLQSNVVNSVYVNYSSYFSRAATNTAPIVSGSAIVLGTTTQTWSPTLAINSSGITTGTTGWNLPPGNWLITWTATVFCTTTTSYFTGINMSSGIGALNQLLFNWQSNGSTVNAPQTLTITGQNVFQVVDNGQNVTTLVSNVITCNTSTGTWQVAGGVGTSTCVAVVPMP